MWKHMNKLRALKAKEEEEHLKAVNWEHLQEKVQIIISTIEGRPMPPDSEWIPMGNFLKIWKLDIGAESSREFLVTIHHDESELISEILEWLDL